MIKIPGPVIIIIHIKKMKIAHLVCKVNIYSKVSKLYINMPNIIILDYTIYIINLFLFKIYNKYQYVIDI